MDKKEIPKVFISYSWDNDTHKKWVLELSDKLCKDGIDCTIDQYHQESNTPKEDWPLWMQKRNEESKYVLIVCTEIYKERYMQEGDPNRGFGVNYESVIARKSIYKNRSQNTKYLAIIYNKNDRQYIPEDFNDTVYDLSNCNLADPDLSEEDNQYRTLLRHLTDQPSVIKPEVGICKKMPPINSKPSNKKIAENAIQINIDNLFSTQQTVFNQIKKWLAPGEIKNSSKKISLDDFKEQVHHMVTPTLAQLNAFPGLGKTVMANVINEYAKSIEYDTAYINLWEETDSYYDDIMLNLDAHYSSHFKKINTAELNSLLDKKVLIIIDDFQYALKKDNTLKKEINFLKNLTRTKKTGKILFVSNKKINFEAREGEVVVFKPEKIGKDEAEHFFKNELELKGYEDRVPDDQVGKIVKLLNHNPRAIKIFISQFEYIADYNDILSKIPESPLDTDDAEINQIFLYNLEEQLLSDSLKRLDSETKDIMKRLSIYRTNIPNDIFKKSEKYLDSNIEEIDKRKIALINSLFMETRRNWYHLNPIAKEIMIRKISDDERVGLHALANNYYARHFESKQTVKNKKLGSDFIEARYHMKRSGQIERLSKISMRYASYLLSEINITAKPPSDPNSLDERIMLLKALFEHGGPNNLAWHYTRCLLQRNKGDDCKEALKIFENIRYEGDKERTRTFLELTRIEYGIDSAIQKGRGLLMPLIDRGAEEIYLYLTHLYEIQDKIPEAIELLQEGIKNIPTDKNVFALYQEASRLLDQEGRTEKAIGLLQEGIKNIPVDKNVFALYQEASKLMNQEGRTEEAIELLQEGIKNIPEQYSRYKVIENALLLACSKQNIDWIDKILELKLSAQHQLLANIFKLQIQSMWFKSAEKFDANVAQNYIAIYGQCAFSYLCAGMPDKAQEILNSYSRLTYKLDSAFSWLTCFIALRNNDKIFAHDLYKSFKGSDEIDIPAESDLLEDWQKSKEEKTEVAYVFPHLPPIITTSL